MLLVQAMPYRKRVLFQLALFGPVMFAFHLKAQATGSFNWVAPTLGLLMTVFIVWDGVDTLLRRSRDPKRFDSEDA